MCAAVAPFGASAAPLATTTGALDATNSEGQFRTAEQAVAAGHPEAAIESYKALAKNADRAVRSEARFRAAQLLSARGHFTDAAVLLRAALDDLPDARPIRLEFARTLAMMGREPSARRELHQAQVTPGTPQEAEQIRRFPEALMAGRFFSGTVEVAFAPSSYIDRANTATTLNMNIVPFTLGNSARIQSGPGLRVSGFSSLRANLADHVALRARFTSHNNIYSAAHYDDNILSDDFAIEGQWQNDRLRLGIGQAYRIYYGRLVSTTSAINGNWLHNLGHRSHIEIEADVGDIRYARTPNQSGQVYAGSLTFEHAFSARAGARLSVVGQRETAKAPGYAVALVGTSLLAWHEFGKATLSGTFGVQHLIADRALPLYADRRNDWLFRIGGNVAFRKFKVFGFSPAVRVSYENNVSSVRVFAYHRADAEIAFNHAF